MAAKSELRSTPRFLEPYGPGDRDIFPPRKTALDKLYRVFKRTSLMVLHGPSGSGKTSLINCGFFARTDIPEHAIFSLRRRQSYFQALQEELKIRDLDEGLAQNIHDYLDAELVLRKSEQLLDDYNNMILWLETGNRRFREQVKSDFPDTVNIAELVEKRDAVKAKDTSVGKLREQLIGDFRGLFSRLKTSPLFIFDDFEEIFIDGSEEERMRFGIFSQFLLDTSAPVNSVIVIDEDYFGHLDEFTEFIPRIFYNSIRILDPRGAAAHRILDSLFHDDGDPEVTNRIFESLTIHGERMHLPFLQIFLRIYVDKFGMTFHANRVRLLGDFEAATEQYFREVNDRILERSGLTDKEMPYVLKYLKTYVSDLTGQARRLPVEHLSRLQDDVWVVQSGLDLNKVSKYLVEEGILVKRGDQYELAHASLAPVISGFTIREDLLKKDFETSFQVWRERSEQTSTQPSGLLERFKEFVGLSSSSNLLSRGQVVSMKPHQEYIMAGDAEDLSAKKEFWSKSKKDERKWRRRLIGALIIFGLVSLGFAGGTYIALKKSEKARQSEKQRLDQKQASAVTGKVYEGTGEAWKEYRTDRTSAFNEIQRARLEWSKGDTAVFNRTGTELPPLVSEFENDFYNDFNQFPFYFKDIKLPTKGYVTKTKTRPSGDSLFIMALTDEARLYIYRQDLANTRAAPEGVIELSGISTFEPYVADGELKVLTVGPLDQQSLRIVRINLGADTATVDTLRRSTGSAAEKTSEYISALEHLGGSRFSMGMGRALWDLYVDLGDDLGQYQFGYRMQLPGEIRQIRKTRSADELVVLFGRSGLYHTRADSVIKRSNDFSKDDPPTLPPDLIYTVSYDQPNDRLLLGYNSGIVYSCKLDGTDGRKRDYRHGEAIRSIDVKGDSLLLGSLDKTASLWIGKRDRKRLDKKFIGHTDALYNVSFVNGTNYMISSGEDGHIKLWDLSPTYIRQARIPDAEIRKLDYHGDRGEILVSYRARSVKSLIGRMFAYDTTLLKSGEYRQQLKGADEEDHLIAFDQEEDGALVIAGSNNYLIASAAGHSGKPVRLTNIAETIHDIEIVGKGIYIATTKGILYCQDIYSTIPQYDTLLTGHRVNGLDYSNADSVLVAGRDDDLVILYRNQAPFDTLKEHSDRVSDVQFSENGRFLATAGWDNKMIVWSQSDTGWTILGKPHLHLNDVLDIDFSGDTMLLSAGSDRTVQLYQLSEDQSRFDRMPSLIRHTASVTAAAFYPSGDRLRVVSGDINGVIRIWDIKSFRAMMEKRTYNALEAARADVAAGRQLFGTWELVSGSGEVKDRFPDELELQEGFGFRAESAIWRDDESKWGNGDFAVENLAYLVFAKGDWSRRYRYSRQGDSLILHITDATEGPVYVRK